MSMEYLLIVKILVSEMKEAYHSIPLNSSDQPIYADSEASRESIEVERSLVHPSQTVEGLFLKLSKLNSIVDLMNND